MANEDLLIRKRSAIKAKLTNFCNHVNVLMSCDSLSSLQRIELEGRLRKFDALYDDFDNLQLEIEVLSDKPDEAYGERAKFEERYHAVAAQARSLLISADAGVDGGSVAGSADKNTGASFRHNFVRLPKINLPTFDGSYQCWLEYRDTYLSLIHSSSAIDDISKFHYLRASLTGDAQQVIKNIDFKSEHYQLAWNLLCERYDNSRLLVKNHVQTLFNTPAILKESCVALRQFVDNINKQIRALKSLNEPTDQWSTLVVIMMSSRLDKVTNRDWEEYSNTLPKFPTLSEFCSFVSKRADLLETVEHSKSTNKEDSSTNSYTVNTNNSKKNYNITKPKPNTNKEFNNCPLCKNNHFMFVCDDFRKLSVENRLAKVKELNVCFNCLRPGHSSKRCKLSHCKYCNRKHNTLLHVEQSNSTVQDPMPSSVALPSLLTDDVSGGAQLQNGTSESVVMSSDTAATTRSVLLSTALVTVVSTRGEKFDARILLDNGSTANFITETLCHKLGLPRRNVNSTISGESYEMAKRRFLSLERRFLRDPSFKERYVAFMEEYERLGHMTENTTSRKPHSGDGIEYFLPHHGVIRESSSTTKLRAVFDASAATTSGVSFNQIQMVGPTIQEDLLSILLRFRQYKYVISGDIARMYRAVAVTPSQRPLQQIIFRTDPKLPLKTYCLNTVTYGTASAPYLATKCLVSLANVATSPTVKSSIERDFYIDDYLSGGNSVSGVVEMVKEVISVLASANFHIRKWQSNSSSILDQVCDSSTVVDCLRLSEDKNASSKTLGLRWMCEADYLAFSISIDDKKQVSKRQILSVISQIFDPLGLVGPCVVEAKIVMQKLWLDKCDWDEQVPESIYHFWSNFVNTLPCLNNLRIPRWVVCDNAILHEIHVFTDASERAFGCCVYLRSVNMEGAVKVQLIASKNRVAPIKPTTIPRLELCGALLGARLCAKVQSSITLPITRCQFWCDSTIVLSWLAMSPNVLKPFVRNRVNEIQESTAGHTWSYVPSRVNPADLVSRGLKADLISECSLWWSGPEFLLNDETHWPAMPNKTMKQDLPEVITSNFTDHSFLTDTQKHAQHTNTNTSIIHTLLHKYSNINRLQRVVAYILRFYNNVKNKIKDKNPLSIKELQDSLNFILRQAQMEMFSKEYDILKAGKTLPRKNRLICLSPFVDEDGLIRVGGRLDNSPYDYNIKHPILLCCKHHITKLIFHKYHHDLLHAGPQLLIASIRQMYWPLGGRNLSKSVVKHCIKCFKFKCQNVQPVMGQLPVNRTQLEFPFLNSSVDYAGPILIADRRGRGCKLVKAYLCIFVCLAVKAVHIELVTDLTKEGYMAALNRFVARRGKPKSILSDNGTNFVGTCNELQQFLKQSNISYEVAQRGIEFTFAPPYSPHFNGIAEAAVRSTKHHLKRLLQLTHFTYEEMVTCLTQIEAVLNSRPLTPLSSDPLDFTVLTPSHFLIGRSLMAVPHPQVSDVNIGRLERYHRVEHIKQHFWKRFHLEYISLLQQKTKWTSSTGQLAEGTLVLIKERGQPPMLWPLGRVTKVFPGSDGITRVAELKTRKGTILRSFNNICPLPLD
nr:uncharacterized protein LOC126053427 isoform X1 [Helicoverpa armigera]